MGGERFDASQPEAYLFGENSDLNFLASRPLPFPYPAPQPNEPTRPLRCLINIRKESLRFVRVKTGSGNNSEGSTKKNASSDDTCNGGPSPGTTGSGSTKYNIEFIFDTECRCAITVLYFCTEEVTPNGIVYCPRFPTMSSETYHYKRGCNQLFQQTSHVFDPSKYSDAELAFNNNYTMFLADIQRCERAVDGMGLGGGAGGVGAGAGGGSSPNGGASLSGFGNGIGGGGCDSGSAGEVFPVVIHCVAEEGEEPRQSHVLLAVVERASSAMMGSGADSGGGGSISQPTGSSYTLKPLKQKLFVDGLVYLLQEIYGIENKNNICSNSNIHNGCSQNNGCSHGLSHNDDGGSSIDGVGGLCDESDSEEESGGECVICMSEPRDTLILPCRHLCLCAACADSLRYQANNCPICRAPFRALLQIRAVRKMLLSSHPSAHLNNEHQLHQVGQDVPAGYESIPLLEALNGPMGGNQAMITSQIGQAGKHVRLHANSSSANPSHSPRSECHQQGGPGKRSNGSGSGSGGGAGGGGKIGKMHRNKSSSAGSLRHQQQQLQTHSPLRISEQMALVSNSARDGSGVNSIGQLEGTMTMLGTEENQPLARAETAPLPGRHRRHKDKLQGQLQQQGRGLGKSARPHTASHASATSLAMDNLSAESTSLLDGEDNGRVAGDGTLAGEGCDRGDFGVHSAFPPPGSPSPAAATVITVDQATDTSLDNRDLHGSREDARDMDMLFQRRKAFPDSGSCTVRAGSESEPAELELVEQVETGRVVAASTLAYDSSGTDLPTLAPGTPKSGSARSSADSFSSAGSGTRLLVNATTGSSTTSTGAGGHAAVTVVTIKQQQVRPTCGDTEEV
ncbi:RING finger protein 157-like isoform X2 [Varroa jacobsoni]|nr:RING finger protein 157-like isoform X2 [Varroa destructor]XP_022699410.1 RING finger protein 157-like isoform X2 [Varroa jacobsoni]